MRSGSRLRTVSGVDSYYENLGIRMPLALERLSSLTLFLILMKSLTVGEWFMHCSVARPRGVHLP